MTGKNKLSIRINRTGHIRRLFGGLVFAAIGIFGVCVASRLRDPDFRVALSVLPIVIGVCVIFDALRHMLDDQVKLSLTPEGIQDRRNNVLVRWTDYRGARLHVETVTNGLISGLTSAVMYVSIVDGAGEREIVFDLWGLDRSPEEILELTHRWSSGGV